MKKLFFRLRRIVGRKKFAFANGGMSARSAHSLIYKRKRLTLRQKIYLFVCVFGVMSIINPLVVFADFFGYEVADVYVNITNNVRETNEIIEKAFDFAKTSPYDVVNSIAGTTQGNLAVRIHSAVISTALAVATLLIMVDFFKKTINFEWSSRWENILLFLVKIIVIKQVIQNADVIIGYIYALFDYINTVVTGNMNDFLPYGTATPYTVAESFWEDPVNNITSYWKNFFNGKGFVGSADVKYRTYLISHDAVKMFYNDVDFPNSTANSITSFPAPPGTVGFSPTFEVAMWQPYFLVMKAIAYLIFVKVIGRIFELCIFTLFAPLPLATFASEESKEVGKNFIKNYIACVLEIAVIAIMFVAFFAVRRYMNTATIPAIANIRSTKLIEFVVLVSFGLAVIKSGSWSKKLCGAG